MTFSALDSAITGPLFATDAMRAVFADPARIAAMLRVEAALARAEARHGLVPAGLAAAIEGIRPEDFDLDALGAATVEAGVPVIPFVEAVEKRLPEKLRAGLHLGTTSQDIADTATALQMAEAFALVADDLREIIAGLSRSATRYRTTPCAGRTYGQHAAPVTFGFIAATWLAGIADAASGLPDLRRRTGVVSLGGPVGTGAGFGIRRAAVVRDTARDLGLGVPAAPWHVLRGRIAETGMWLAILIGALAKMAEDVVRLSATEVGEVLEPHEAGRGGSSALPHKRNPVSSTILLAAHSAAKGHAVTLLDAMAAEHQRPAGAWHAEWHALPPLFGLASGALREARRLATGLVADTGRMRQNLDMTGGRIMAGAVAAALAPILGRAAAHSLVEAAAGDSRRAGTSLRDVLLADPRLGPVARTAVEASFDIAPAVAAAAAAVDPIVAEARTVRAALVQRKRKG